MEIRTRTIERLRDALLASGRRQSPIVSSAYSTLARQGLLSEEEQAALARVDAVAEVLFLVMAADEQITDTEMQAVRGAIRGLTGEVLNEGVVDVMIERYALQLRDQGRAARLEEIAKTISDPSETETAFALAAAVALADDEAAASERELMVELGHWFGLDEAQQRTILDQLAEDAAP